MKRLLRALAMGLGLLVGSTVPVHGASFIGPDVAGLPTTGGPWTALKAAADASAGTPNLCDQDNRTHPKVTLAAALVYARTGSIAYRTKAINGIEAAYPTQTPGCHNAVLSLGRQLGAYVLAADYVGYRGSAWLSWLSAIRSKEIGGHTRWHVLRFTSGDSSNNWGTFALASITAADAYLGDSANLGRDWSIFKGYGDNTWTFRHTSSYQAVWSCPAPYAINPASCTTSNKEGAAVEDASRTAYPTLGGYPAEAAQGYVVQAELLARAGYPAWTTGTAQVCRNAAWRGRLANINHSSADYYVTWVTNKRCGFSQATKAAGYGRVFGFTDWLFG